MIASIIIGVFVGLIAKLFIRHQNPVRLIMLGIAGALIGGLIGNALGLYQVGGLSDIAGAILLLFITAYGPSVKNRTSHRDAVPQTVDERTVKDAASLIPHSISPERGTTATQDASEPPAGAISKSSAIPKDPSSVGSAGSRQRIFLSYRREDSVDAAGRIYDRLVHQFGSAQVFKDVDSIPLGVDFRKHLTDKVGSCDIVLAVIGINWQTANSPDGKRRLDDAKDFVRIELEAALQRDIPVIPVLVQGAQVPKESDLPSTLATLAYRNGIAVRADPDFHRDMDRLIEGVVSHLSRLS